MKRSKRSQRSRTFDGRLKVKSLCCPVTGLPIAVDTPHVTYVFGLGRYPQCITTQLSSIGVKLLSRNGLDPV